MGQLVKYWHIIIGILSLVAGYAVLSYSVSDHIKTDTALGHEQTIQINIVKEDVAVLKAAQTEFARNQAVIMQDIKEILRRVK